MTDCKRKYKELTAFWNKKIGSINNPFICDNGMLPLS